MIPRLQVKHLITEEDWKELSDKFGVDVKADIQGRVERHQKLHSPAVLRRAQNGQMPLNRALGHVKVPVPVLAENKNPLMEQLVELLKQSDQLEYLGEGSDAAAFEYKGKVVRVCMGYRAETMERFVELVQANPNKHFPHFYGSGHMSSFYWTMTEKLEPVSKEKRELMDACLALHRTGRYDSLLGDKVRQYYDSHPQLVQALDLVIKGAAQYMYGLDINRGRNVMRRGDTLVIIDPWFKRIV